MSKFLILHASEITFIKFHYIREPKLLTRIWLDERNMLLVGLTGVDACWISLLGRENVFVDIVVVPYFHVLLAYFLSGKLGLQSWIPASCKIRERCIKKTYINYVTNYLLSKFVIRHPVELAGCSDIGLHISKHFGTILNFPTPTAKFQDRRTSRSSLPTVLQLKLRDHSIWIL